MMNTAKIITLISLTFFLTTLQAQEIKEVKVKTDHGKLYGTLVKPDGKETVPVVLIIAGSGPTDRNGNSMMLQPNTYKMLANALVEKGIASLRYDKQGVGKSSDAQLTDTALTFENIVKDANEWIKFLKKKGDYSSITIIGHSQGSLIGILAAQQESVNAYISLAGAGNTIDKILKKQLAIGAASYQEDTDRILSSLRKGDTTHNVPEQLMSIFSPTTQPFLISWIKYDPSLEISKLDIPILIIQGTTDIQVHNNEAEILSKSANSEVQYIEGMNHILKSAPADREKNIQTYYDPNLPLNEQIIMVILNFVREIDSK